MAHRSNRGLGTNGADDYPYDSSLSVLELQGLERLRVVADRQLAQYLYVLHTQAERNSVAGGPMRPTKKALRTEATERLAQRALSGELGPDARELAAYILLDDVGRRSFDTEKLQTFLERLQELL